MDFDLEGGDAGALGEPRPGDRVRLLVIGDAGVGKSSLLHLVCHGTVLRGATATVGCHIETKLMRHQGASYYIELVEVGGAEKFRSARSVFFMQRFDGVIMVHDLTNRNSRANLERWRRELHDKQHDDGNRHSDDDATNLAGLDDQGARDPWQTREPARVSSVALTRRQSSSPGPPEEWVEASEMGWIPCITVGSKLDLLPPGQPQTQLLEASMTLPLLDLGRLHAFFARVIEHKRGDGGFR